MPMALIKGRIAAFPGAAPSEYCSRYFVAMTAILSSGIASENKSARSKDTSSMRAHTCCVCVEATESSHHTETNHKGCNNHDCQAARLELQTPPVDERGRWNDEEERKIAATEPILCHLVTTCLDRLCHGNIRVFSANY